MTKNFPKFTKIDPKIKVNSVIYHFRMTFHRVRISDIRPDRSPKFQPILPRNFRKFTRLELRKLAQILADLKREDFYLTAGAEPVIMR